jgi:hypothetical protein
VQAYPVSVKGVVARDGRILLLHNDPAFLAHALAMHGNELRKNQHPGAVDALERAAATAPAGAGRGTAAALLAPGCGQRR